MRPRRQLPARVTASTTPLSGASKLTKEKQLTALKQYEKAASDKREEMASSILPGREPPCVGLSNPSSNPPPVVSPLLSSRLLPTDSKAIQDPFKTLESVPATGVIGSLTSTEREEQRERDADYCARHFAGHVVRSPLEAVLTRLGTSAMVEKLSELEAVASLQLKPTTQRAIVKNFGNESKSMAPDARKIEGRYWLSRLADAARKKKKPAAALPAIDYFPASTETLPEEKQHGYKKKRKYDASLRPSAADRSTILNILVNVEFTNISPPNVASNPLIGATKSVGKYQQAITNADDLLTFQPTRLSVPTLSFHGKGKKAKLFVSILSHECFEFAVIDDCFGVNISMVSALLHLFRIVPLYQLGYNPLFIYSFTTPLHGFSVGDAMPAEVVFPAPQGAVKVRLTGKRLSQLRSIPFQRSTVVLAGYLVKQSPDSMGSTYVVVKISYIADHRVWREKIIVDALHTADIQPAPAYAPKIIAAFAAHGSYLTKHPEILRNTSERPAINLPAMVRRHLEIMAFESPPDARALKYVTSAAGLLTAARDLFLAILDAFRRRALHRDISVNNILVANNQLVMIDWEIGRLFQEPSFAAVQGTVTGTLDTMSVGSLANWDPLPQDDLESAIYVLLKVLTKTFVPAVGQQSEWAVTLRRYCWDDPNVDPLRLQDTRSFMWTSYNRPGTLVFDTLEMFRRAGHATRAQLILSLLSLPLPADHLIDTSDYDGILSSLERLVDQAVTAVDSVDASSLIWSGARVADAGQEGI